MKKIIVLFFGLALLFTINNARASTGGKWNIQKDLNNKSEATYLFVMHSKDGYIKGDELFLNNVFQNTVYFSDRPYRIAGHMDTEKFLSTWGEGGDDAFNKNFPNIVISFKKDGKYVDMTLEVSNPAFDGDDVTFKIDNVLESDVKVEDGKKIKFKYPSLFIDGHGCWVFGC
jgi:hypothetical protein